MRIAAFLQLRNELEKGNLRRCLDNCREWATDIFIYDDCSDDGSQSVYEEYTDKDKIIFGEKPDFKNEIFHKDQLLKLTLSSNPDWIVWQDGDAIMDSSITNDCQTFLQTAESLGYEGIKIHYMNLWRSESYFRLDNLFNALWVNAFWKNNGSLHYKAHAGFHNEQHPFGMNKILKLDDQYRILHFGFSTLKQILRRYYVYISYGESRKFLHRLVDEQTKDKHGNSFTLQKAPKELYPDKNLPKDYDVALPPTLISWEELIKYNSWEEFCESERGNGLLQQEDSLVLHPENHPRNSP